MHKLRRTIFENCHLRTRLIADVMSPYYDVDADGACRTQVTWSARDVIV